MALTYVGGKTVAIAGTTSTTAISLTDLTGGAASAPAAEDIVVIGFGVGSAGDEAPGVTTSGYTEEQELFSDSSDDTNLSVSWKIMGGTPDTSVTVSGTGNSGHAGVVAIQVWRGVDTTTPFDVAETTNTGTGNDRPDPPAITPVSAGAIVLAIGAGAQGSAAVFTSGDLSNFITNTSAGTKDCAIGMGSIAWTSGAVNPAQFGGGADSGASRSWAAVTLALRPSKVAPAAGTANGTANVNGVSVTIASSAGTAAGVSAALGSSNAVASQSGTAAGSAIVTAANVAIAAADGTSAGATAVSGAGAAIEPRSGGAVGTAAALGSGAAIVPASGTAAGEAIVSGLGVALGAVGGAAGSATVSGISAAVIPVEGTSAGAATAAGEGGSVSGAIGNAEGGAAVAGNSQAIATVSGAAAGVAAAFGDIRAFWPVAGSAAGSTSVLGIGEHAIVMVTPADRIVFLGHDGSNELTLEHDGSSVAFLTHDASNVVYL